MSKSEIIQPLDHQPDALVENIYPLAGTEDVPDLESQDVTGEHLIDRFTPEEGPRSRVVLAESGRTMPGIRRAPAGFKRVTRLGLSKEWLVTPRAALATVLGSMALFNGVGNFKSIEEGTAYVGHGIYRTFVPVGSTTAERHERVVTPGHTARITVNMGAGNRVGSTRVDEQVVKSFLGRVDKARREGARISEVSVTGNTSDEWADDATIGQKNPDNTRLGEARAKAAAEALEADGLKAKIKESEREHVLTGHQKSRLLREARADGYPTIKAAIEAVDDHETVPKSLSAKIKRFFTGKRNRGVSLSATVQYPGKNTISTKTEEVTVPGKDQAPDVPTPGWNWFIPMIPIRRFRRYSKIKPASRWQFTPSMPIMRPEVIHEDQEHVWLRLRPEAVKEDGTLVDHPWAYTRKYEHLLRDGRIADVLRADYKTAGGDEKSIRVMFVDERPSEETVKAFSGLLEKFAGMEDGKIADRISGIFVYASENAGTAHNNPKRIAMGIDKQSSENVLGTYTPVLDLVELHIPTSLDPEQLAAMFTTFNGPAWVAAHEIAGHGTDETDAQLRLRRVRARGIPQAHVIDGESHADRMGLLEGVLDELEPGHNGEERPRCFDITYPVIDNNGRQVTVQAQVLEGDPRLAHATESTIVGHQPTQYASTNTAEHYAETAAAVTTGITIPYDEAEVGVPQLQTDDGQPAAFEAGYRPDTRGQHLFTDAVGGVEGTFPIQLSELPDTHILRVDPADDPLLKTELNRARRLRSLRPEQMVAILARVAHRRRSAGNRRSDDGNSGGISS